MGVSGFTMEIFSERLHTYGDDDESHVDYVFQNCFPSFFFFYSPFIFYTRDRELHRWAGMIRTGGGDRWRRLLDKYSDRRPFCTRHQTLL